jgi:hypothetical protein
VGGGGGGGAGGRGAAAAPAAAAASRGQGRLPCACRAAGNGSNTCWNGMDGGGCMDHLALNTCLNLTPPNLFRVNPPSFTLGPLSLRNSIFASCSSTSDDLVLAMDQWPARQGFSQNLGGFWEITQLFWGVD